MEEETNKLEEYSFYASVTGLKEYNIRLFSVGMWYEAQA